MSKNEETVEVVEETADDEVTEAEVEAILGATPAEEAPEPEPVRPSVKAVADARAQIAELLDKGYVLSQLTVTTNSRGEPIAVELA